MNSLLDSIGDYFTTPSLKTNDPSELTKLISLPGSPVQQYGWGGAIHNQLLGMVNPHAVGNPSMWDLMKAADNGDDNARQQVAMNLGGAFAGMTDPVYHGTAGIFDKFSNAAIGSGEGNQSFGYGHYLAQNPNIARSYQAKIGGENGNILTAKIKPEEDQFLDLDKTLEQQPDILNKLQNLPEDFKDRLADTADNFGYNSPLDSPEAYTGKQFIKAAQHYDITDHPSEVSDLLSNVGISGNKYADASSRNKLNEISKYNEGIQRHQNFIDTYNGQINSNKNNPNILPPFFDKLNSQIADQQNQMQMRIQKRDQLQKDLNVTRNFVVFDPNDIDITHWNNIPVKEE